MKDRKFESNKRMRPCKKTSVKVLSEKTRLRRKTPCPVEDKAEAGIPQVVPKPLKLGKLQKLEIYKKGNKIRLVTNAKNQKIYWGLVTNLLRQVLKFKQGTVLGDTMTVTAFSNLMNEIESESYLGAARKFGSPEIDGMVLAYGISGYDFNQWPPQS